MKGLVYKDIIIFFKSIDHEQYNCANCYQNQLFVNTLKEDCNIFVNQTFHAAPPLM